MKKRCKHGVNKNTGACLKSPRRKAGAKKRKYKASGRKGCKYGMLKNPTKRRRCRKRPRR